MAGRLAIDFGTSNTVVAVWDEISEAAATVHVADFGRLSEFGSDRLSVIPSLIHYAADGSRWIGDQVLARNLLNAPHTFRWMKRYIGLRTPTRVRIHDRQVSHAGAGSDFLSAVLINVRAELEVGDEEIALTVPVEAYEHYERWLTDVAEAADLPRFRLIDEPSAAALGYGAHIQPGDVYLIFDFGGGTLDVSVVLIEEEDQSHGGRRCRVLGKAGVDIGGTKIDEWIFQDVLRRNQRTDADEEIRALSRVLLSECEWAKIRLSETELTTINVVHPHSGSALTAELSRNDLENILDAHNAFSDIDRTIRRALQRAHERGYVDEHIKAVLMVGGSSLVPAVQKLLQRIFGRNRVRLDRPIDAVARGGAAFVGGVDFFDHIQHDYAMQAVNTLRGDYEYRILVNRGTPYPTEEAIARYQVKATYDGQTQLGIAIYELGENQRFPDTAAFELVFDPAGDARLARLEPREHERRKRFWMNEGRPTFLIADPPAKQGEVRYEIEFRVDANKRLLLSARDLRTGRVTHDRFPVVKLT